MTILCQGDLKKKKNEDKTVILYQQEMLKKRQRLDTFGTQSEIQEFTMIYAHFYVGKKSGDFKH
jgi:hypothetical protein